MKKKSSKVIISLMVACTILFACSLSGFALTVVDETNSEPTVTLGAVSSDSVGFSFNRDDTDLFDNFKDVVPGDVLTQSIFVQNKASSISGSTTFEIYLYAENGEISNSEDGDTPDDLFDQITFTVTENGQTLELKKTDDTSKGVSLGTFDLDDIKQIDITMEVPLELGNEYQNAIGTINWYFYAEQVEEEEIEDDDTPLDNPEDEEIDEDEVPALEEIIDETIPLESLPKTNDNSKLIVFAGLGVVSAVGIITLNAMRRKTKNRD